MHGSSPSHALTFDLGLSGIGLPVRLRADHRAACVGGPDDVADRLGCGPEAALAGMEVSLDPLLVERRRHDGHEQDHEGRPGHDEREVLCCWPTPTPVAWAACAPASSAVKVAAAMPV